MNDDTCPVCDSPRPASRTGNGPWCCSIACYRSFHGIEPASSSCHAVVTIDCPVCQHPFGPVGRQRYCCDACRAAAYRRRNDAGAVPNVVPPAARPQRPITVYECDGCSARAVGEQRYGDCGPIMGRVGIGGCCPSCDQPVAVAELHGREVTA